MTQEKNFIRKKDRLGTSGVKIGLAPRRYETGHRRGGSYV